MAGVFWRVGLYDLILPKNCEQFGKCVEIRHAREGNIPGKSECCPVFEKEIEKSIGMTKPTRFPYKMPVALYIRRGAGCLASYSSKRVF